MYILLIAEDLKLMLPLKTWLFSVSSFITFGKCCSKSLKLLSCFCWNFLNFLFKKSWKLNLVSLSKWHIILTAFIRDSVNLSLKFSVLTNLRISFVFPLHLSLCLGLVFGNTTQICRLLTLNIVNFLSGKPCNFFLPR